MCFHVMAQQVTPQEMAVMRDAFSFAREAHKDRSEKLASHISFIQLRWQPLQPKN